MTKSVLQRCVDAVQDLTGLTSYRQSAMLAWTATALMMTAMIVGSVEDRIATPGGPYLTASCTGLALAVMGKAALARRNHVLGVFAACAAAALALVLVEGGLYYGLLVWFAASADGKAADLPAFAAIGFCTVTNGVARVAAKRHRDFVSALSRGEIPAAQFPSSRWRHLLNCLIAAAAALIAAERWPDAVSTTTASAFAVHALSHAVLDCRPRPPRADRRRRRMPMGRTQAA